ncbi:MAG: polyphenol oxidase family protein, partial [Planctomycetota bacterium]|nr:polyphenol oxidase family protein [Planctomycetota bacterium]
AGVLNGFQFSSPAFINNGCYHVFGGRNSSNLGNFALSGGRNLEQALEVRRSWCKFLQTEAMHLVVGGQTHTSTVRLVDESHQGRGALSPNTVLPNCDGLITRTPNLPLYVAVADCSAVLLSAPGMVGVIHGGWRGLAADILTTAIDIFLKSGVSPATISAGIAPCIQAESYEVGPEVAADCPESAKYRGSGDRWQVDIALWARHQLLNLGLCESRIELSGIDSGVDSSVFSHRRQGEQAGRNGLVALLR